jgi:hypothetical protein
MKRIQIEIPRRFIAGLWHGYFKTQLRQRQYLNLRKAGGHGSTTSAIAALNR